MFTMYFYLNYVLFLEFTIYIHECIHIDNIISTFSTVLTYMYLGMTIKY